MNIQTFYLYFIGLLAAQPALAQKNILRNGGFEAHGTPKCLGCELINNQYPSIVYHWDNGNWDCILCDQNYRPHPGEAYGEVCLLGKIAPQSGKTMISMTYQPFLNGIFNGVEGAAHLTARTTEPMQVGQRYDISMWLHIPSGTRRDPDWSKHLGIALLPHNLSYFNANHPIIIPFIPADTLLYDQWFQVKWRVRPLCTSQYLMIGVFADRQWPRSRSYAEVRYFLDDVSVVEIPETPTLPDSSIYYCSQYDPIVLQTTPRMDPKILLYENDAFDLTPAHQAALDTVARYAKRSPSLVFDLSGHTDSLGNDNLTLSQNRAQTALRYLTERHQIPAHRFHIRALAGREPYRPNHTETGRRLNRRTVVCVSPLTVDQMCYRFALKTLQAQNRAQTFYYLNQWAGTVPEGSPILVLFDPRFDDLKQDPRWAALQQKIRKGYAPSRSPDASFYMDSLRWDACRFAGTPMTQVLQSLTGQDTETTPSYLPEATEAAARKRYAAHFEALQPLLAKTGWPLKDQFSESAVNNTFWLLLGSEDIAAYLTWLPVLKQACEAGHLPWIMYAKCYDLSRTKLGQPQRYLTQYQLLEDGSVQLPPWEGNQDTVLDARKSIGLPMLPQAVLDIIRY